MTIAERHKYILAQLTKDGFVRVADLSKDLDVTLVTIRKDLKELEEKGLLYRTHGSASPVNPHISDRHVSDKERVNTEEKQRIAARAAEMLDENDSILINSGTTICAFAEAIKAKKSLTVVSASLKATLILSEKGENVNIVQLGGLFSKKAISVVGNYAASILDEVACSKLFLGVDGIDPEFGVTTSNMEEADLNKKMMTASFSTILLADSSKFRKRGFGKICDLDKIDIIITDTGISKSMADIIENMGVKLICV